MNTNKNSKTNINETPFVNETSLNETLSLVDSVIDKVKQVYRFDALYETLVNSDITLKFQYQPFSLKEIIFDHYATHTRIVVTSNEILQLQRDATPACTSKICYTSWENLLEL
jgi:hypothetical protein